MKTINRILRVFSVLAVLTAVLLLIFFNKGEGELIGSTGTVIISSFLIYFATYIDSILTKRNMKISNTLYLILLLTTFLSVGGGFIFRFYIIFNYYDTVIHFLNGGIIVIIAFAVLKYFARDDNKHTASLIIVAVLVSISLGTIWEIYEFAVDSIVDGSNMQRFRNVHDAEELWEGQKALMDTMVDLIVDTLGAILAGFILYIDKKNGRKFINKISFEHIENNELEKDN